jgi:hypothetical protein
MSQYVGTGIVAKAAELIDRLDRGKAAVGRRKVRDELAGHRRAGESLGAAVDSAEALVAALLVGAGFHRHNRGEWRRRRGID